MDADATPHHPLSHADEITSDSLATPAQVPAEVLARARAVAEAITTEARADAEDLLSRAHMQAELLRVNAEAVRAEAECLRAEAAALRATLRDEVELARSHVEVAAQRHTEADDVRRNLLAEADAARAEFERTRTEAMSIRRLLRAEIDAGLADAQQMRSEVQRLWAETDKLAAELRLLCARAAGTSDGREVTDDAPPMAGAAPAGPQADDDGGSAAPAPAASPDVDRNVAELLNEIWDAVSEELSPRLGRHLGARPVDPGGDDDPEDRPDQDRAVDRTGAAQPLIGSGGWRSTGTPSPDAAPPDREPGHDEDSPPAPGIGRRRRRFHSR